MVKTYVLTSYACSGKTSLQKALTWELSTNLPNFIVVPLPEYVVPAIDGFELLETIVPNKDDVKINSLILQGAILGSSLNSIVNSVNLIKVLEAHSNRNSVLIMDRSIIDAIVFTYMKAYKHINADDIIEFIERNATVTETIEMFMEYFKPTFIILDAPDEEVLEKCFQREARKRTIDKNTFLQSFKKFEDSVIGILKRFKVPYERFKHPGSNSYVLYDICLYIFNALKKEGMLM